jgi:nitrite reductase (cytochrome c-552)
MRSFVCGQCHVEYFCGKGTTIFFPWDRGLKAEEIEAAYDNLVVKGRRFKDWTHAETGVEVLKAQHPEFEVWSQGIHARSGVACADCHMPYKREGALKVSEHWVRSPLLHIPRACETCHPYGEKEIAARVEAIQDRHFALLTRAGEAAVAMLDSLVAVRKGYDEAGWRDALENDPAIRRLGELQRAAQWRLDFVAAENSMGFHAPQELARILGESIDLSRQAQAEATRLASRTAASAEVHAAP